MKDDLSFSFNDSFPPKRNFKVGKFQQRTARHPPLLMKLLPTCTFNFTPSSPFLFLFVRLLSLFFFLPLSPSLFPFFSLTFLTSVHPSITSSPSYKPLGSYSFIIRLCVVYCLFPYGRPLRLSFDKRSSTLYTTSFPRNIENSLWTSFIPFFTSFENVVLQTSSSRAR